MVRADCCIRCGGDGLIRSYSMDGWLNIDVSVVVCKLCHGTGCKPVASDSIERDFYCDGVGD